jgi:hypothetical protein
MSEKGQFRPVVALRNQAASPDQAHGPRHLARVGGMAPQSRLPKHPADASPSR